MHAGDKLRACSLLNHCERGVLSGRRILLPGESGMSNEFIPLKLEDGQEIQIEVAKREGLQQTGFFEKVADHTEAIDKTIRNFSRIILQSIDKIAQDGKAPEKISLSFAIKFVGEAGIPAIARGTGEANPVVNMEWKT
jgi:hypothetical protein